MPNVGDHYGQNRNRPQLIEILVALGVVRFGMAIQVEVDRLTGVGTEPDQFLQSLETAVVARFHLWSRREGKNRRRKDLNDSGLSA